MRRVFRRTTAVVCAAALLAAACDEESGRSVQPGQVSPQDDAGDEPADGVPDPVSPAPPIEDDEVGPVQDDPATG
jgi:hypothetical protein